jgi:hypothetical protein
MDRIMACPASLLREKGRSNEDSEAAESGTRVHAALQDLELRLKLSDHELYLVNACGSIEGIIAASVGFGESVFGVEVETERRIWLDEGGTRDVNFSGRFDKVYRFGDRALVVDYKAGRREAPAAAENWQMASYAVLLYIESTEQQRSLSEITVAVIQPMASPDRTIARYSVDEIQQAGRAIVARLREAKDVDAKAIPGKHCYYCKARGDCAEALDYAKQIVRTDEVTIETVGRKQEVRLPEMTPAQLHTAYEMSSTIDRILKAVRERFKDSVKAAEQPDYEMGAGATLLELRNPITVFKRLRQVVPIRRLLGTVKLKVDEMDEIVAISLKVSKTKAREFWVPLVADGLDAKEGAPQVRKKKTDVKSNSD